MTKRWRLGLIASLLLLAGLGGLAIFGVRQLLFERYPAIMEEPVVIEVRRGSSARTVLEELERRHLVRSAEVARLLLIYSLDDAPIQAGEYRFDAPATVESRLRQLVEGKVVLYPITVIEGLTLEETAAWLAAAKHGDEELFLNAMRDPALILDLDPRATDLEGYLFPETYLMARSVSEVEIVAEMVNTFRHLYQREVVPLLESSQEVAEPRTQRQIVSLAAIVEKEALLDDERPVIAGVYAHRLRRGIALYADPTVIFGLKKLGRWDGNLRKSDLKFDTPYNTYIRAGLPPGPICSPGLASLKAAAAPQPTDLLYFVSRNDGSHVFASTLREHNQNVERWQKRYWRERWARQQQPSD